MSDRTVWLASYPKSGNTWVRAIVTALSTHPHLFHVDQLSAGAQPFSVSGSLPAFGLDSRWLDFDENDRLRTALIRWGDGPNDKHADLPLLRKTHEMWRAGAPEREPFPADVTRAALLVVRDPRDIACSYAPFFGIGLDRAIDIMGLAPATGRGQPVQGLTPQPWGTWSDHVRSWLSVDVPFPVHIVRYEDLRDDTVGTIKAAFEKIGLVCTDDELTRAVDRAGFERLQESESDRGFSEVSPNTASFFRQGSAGGWRDELSHEQLAAIEADHGEQMVELGYRLETPRATRNALAESRISERRRAVAAWTQLPGHLGLDVSLGDVPESLDGAVSPQPWVQTTSTTSIVQFGGGNALMVEDGEKVTVQWGFDGTDPAADLGWLVQGWAVTLASLQRGKLSMHASTVRVADEVIAIAGHQGAGKSTSAMGLRARGHRLLIDDTTVVHFADGGAWITPYARNVHLLADSAQAVGVDFEALPFLLGREGKVAFRAEEPPPEPQRLDRIVVLSRPADVETVTIEDVRGAERIELLRNHVSRLGLAAAILGEAALFASIAKLAQSARVQLVRRPAQRWTLDSVLDVIESGPGIAQ